MFDLGRGTERSKQGSNEMMETWRQLVVRL